MQLYPHILFRTDVANSEEATALRRAGYVVTKVRSDDDLARLLRASVVDAVVVQLPLMQAISFARRGDAFDVPVLYITNAPAVLCNLAGSVATLHLHDAGDDLVSTVDLLIVSRQKRRMQG